MKTCQSCGTPITANNLGFEKIYKPAEHGFAGYQLLCQPCFDEQLALVDEIVAEIIAEKNCKEDREEQPDPYADYPRQTGRHHPDCMCSQCVNPWDQTPASEY